MKEYNMKCTGKFLALILAGMLVNGFSVAFAVEQIPLKVSGLEVDCANVPVYVTIDLPKELVGTPIEHIAVELSQPGLKGASHPGQLLPVNTSKVQLWWILPQAKAGETSNWTAKLYDSRRLSRITRPKAFSWRDEPGQYLDLLFDGRKVTRYMYAHDDSTPQRAFETYKPFHHVFDEQGQDLLTNGPDAEHPYFKDSVLYPHHRGLFIGWSRLEFAGSTYNFWGMGGGVVQRHEKFLEQVAGPVLAGSKTLIHWNDKNGEPVIAEVRETTVFRQSSPTILLLDFHTELKAVGGDVYLDGDPEHAGFQYRAHDAVAKGDKEVKANYVFHQDGIDPRQDKDLPWVAMSYGLNDHRYSVQHMNHPDNPKPTVYSAYRDYGRFGAFFKHTISSVETLTLRYRVAVAQREMPEREELVSVYSAFVEPPNVKVLSR